MATITSGPKGKATGTSKKVKKAVVRILMPAVARDDDRTPVGLAIEQGLREAVEISKGKLQPTRRTRFNFSSAAGAKFSPEAIKSLRDQLALSQGVLAAALDVTPRAIANWEQGLRSPDGPSRRMLQLLSVKPDLLEFLVTKR